MSRVLWDTVLSERKERCLSICSLKYQLHRELVNLGYSDLMVDAMDRFERRFLDRFLDKKDFASYIVGAVTSEPRCVTQVSYGR